MKSLGYKTAHLASLATKRANLLLHPSEKIGRSAFMDPNNHSGAAAVIDQGALIGIVTERDLLKRVLAKGRNPNDVSVREIMTPNPLTISVNAGLEDALEVITRSGYRYLPVIDGRKYIGLIDVRDLYEDIQHLLRMKVHKQRVIFSSMMREPYGYGGDVILSGSE